MPAKKLPQIHLMVKTHKLTLALTLYPTQTIRDLKQQAIDALAQFATATAAAAASSSSGAGEEGESEGFPLHPELGDFEVMRRRQGGEEYELLEEEEKAMELRLMAWDRLFLAWRDKRGKLQPVHVDKFSFWGEDEEEPVPVPTPAAPSRAEPSRGKANGGLGKGKRRMEDDYEPDEGEGDIDV